MLRYSVCARKLLPSPRTRLPPHLAGKGYWERPTRRLASSVAPQARRRGYLRAPSKLPAIGRAWSGLLAVSEKVGKTSNEYVQTHGNKLSVHCISNEVPTDRLAFARSRVKWEADAFSAPQFLVDPGNRARRVFKRRTLHSAQAPDLVRRQALGRMEIGAIKDSRHIQDIADALATRRRQLANKVDLFT